MLARLWLISLFITAVCCNKVNGQVGFNNPNPDPSSILDLTAVDKGLLVPRLTTPQRQAIASPGRSLLVFDTTEGKFYFYDGGQWYALNELVRTAGSNNVSLPTGNLSIGGNVSASSLTVSGFPSNSLVPAGVIVMWSGSIASVPSGWALCDGTNFTPDLRERFIVGAGSSYTVGSLGGANTITLSINEIPSHNHTMNSAGLHDHAYQAPLVDGAHPGGSNGYNRPNALSSGYTGLSGDHAHFINYTGGSLPHENRPPYYALAYIMKLP